MLLLFQLYLLGLAELI